MRRIEDPESIAGKTMMFKITQVRRGGSVGDTVWVLNPLTGSVVRALLVTPNTADLEFAASTERSSR